MARTVTVDCPNGDCLGEVEAVLDGADEPDVNYYAVALIVTPCGVCGLSSSDDISDEEYTHFAAEVREALAERAYDI